MCTEDQGLMWSVILCVHVFCCMRARLNEFEVLRAEVCRSCGPCNVTLEIPRRGFGFSVKSRLLIWDLPDK